MLRNLFATVALALLLAARAMATVVYVDAAANGPVHNGSSWATAYTTITAAVNSLAFGGEVRIRAGTYRECITVNSYVTLYGGFLGGETAISQRLIGAFPTIIDAGFKGGTITIPTQARVTLDGLTVRRGVAINGGGICCNTNAIVYIRNCRVENCRALTTGGGVYYGKYTQGQMSDSVITGCSAPNGGGGVVEYHSYPTWRRVVIFRNRATTSGGGLYCPFHSGADLGNCTLVYNTAGATGGAFHAVYGGNSTYNYCIISGNSAPSGGGIYGEGSGAMPTFSHCDFWQNSGENWAGSIPTPSPTAGNFYSDPLFIMPQYDEYHLRAGSPCSGAGAYALESVYKIDRIGVAKMLEDGAQVQLCGKIVGCADGSETYIQEPDRASAIALTGLSGRARSDIMASVTGALFTNAQGVRMLNATASSLHPYGSCEPRPLAARPSWLRSAPGLYARTWGRVTGVSASGFTLSDGSLQLPVRWSGDGVAPGDFVSVSGAYTAGGDFRASSVQHL